MGERRALSRGDLLVAAALFVGYVWLLLKTAAAQGYARDEGFYFHAAESYARWFRLLAEEPSAALGRQAIDGAFRVNSEHPALVKSLFSLSWLLHKKHALFADEGTSFRFPGMCFGGLTVSLVYLWATEVRGRLAGLCAALSFALVPTTFYHAHLACFDVPITAMWLLTAYVYWLSITRGGMGLALLTGVVFGLTLDTKHNSWFLPFAFVAHWLLSRGPTLWRDLATGTLRMPLSLLTMATVGPAVLVLTWPWLWYETASRFAAYVQFHTGHEYYNMEFVGETYFRPPFPRAYAWLMTAATVPVVTLSLFAVGLGVLARERLLPRLASLSGGETSTPPRSPGDVELLWVIGVLINYAPWLSTGTPIFGGTKHWLTAYPFMMLIAGVGCAWVCDELVQRFAHRVRPLGLQAGVLASVLVAPGVETLRSHPWGLSAYTPLVGGSQGAATLGLNRGFWGYTTGSVVALLNERLPPGGSVYIHDTAWESFRMLQRDGRLRGDIRAVGSPVGADAALYHHEQHMEGVEYQEWIALGTTTPAEIKGLDGVPIVWVYLRKGL